MSKPINNNNKNKEKCKNDNEKNKNNPNNQLILRKYNNILKNHHKSSLHSSNKNIFRFFDLSNNLYKKNNIKFVDDDIIMNKSRELLKLIDNHTHEPIRKFNSVPLLLRSSDNEFNKWNNGYFSGNNSYDANKDKTLLTPFV